jgi:hypothetical protein
MVDRSADKKWAQWSGYFDAVEREMFTLFHTRDMWHKINGMLDSSGVERYTIVQNYLVRTYTTTVCSAIRREVDVRRDTTSLTRCLNLLIRSPQSFTWERFSALYPTQDPVDETEKRARAAFVIFAPSGGDVVESAFVNTIIERFTNAARPVKKYTDEIVAHRNTGGTMEPVTVSFDAIDHALDELGAVIRMFHGLRYPGEMLARSTPVVDLTFLRMFQVPWFPEGSIPPRGMDLG